MKIRRALLLFGGGIKRLLNLANLFSFEADHTTPRDGVLPVYKPYGGLGDFTVVRGSSATYVDSDGIIKEAYAVGDELVTNGDFEDGSTGWSLGEGWSIVDRKVVGTTANGYLITTSDIVPPIGSDGILKFTISDYSSGSLTVSLNGTGGAETPTIVENGDYEFNLAGPFQANSTFLTVTPIDFTGSIDNISVKEVSYDIARIDYTNGVAELLTEPQSTNLLLNSVFDGAVAGTPGTGLDNWTFGNSGGSIVSVGQSKYINGQNIRLSATGARQSFRQTVTLGANSFNYYSVDIDVHSNTGTTIANIISALNPPSDSIETYHLNGIEIPFNTVCPLGVNILSIKIETITGGTAGLRFGIGTNGTSTADITFDMPQAEPLGYKTSYIPTNGSTVTRLQDQITDGGNVNVINSEEGVLFFEGSALFDDLTVRRIMLNDGTNWENAVDFRFLADNRVSCRMYIAGASTGICEAVLSDISTNHKYAFKYKSGEFALWIDGIEVSTSTNIMTIAANSFNSVMLSSESGTASFFNARTRVLKVYDRALTDEELEQITTL